MSQPSSEGSGLLGSIGSSRSRSRYSSLTTLGSFPDQAIWAADLDSSASGSGASKKSSQDSGIETQPSTDIGTKVYTIPYGVHTGRLTTASLNIDFILNDTSKGSIKVWPKSMEEYLSLKEKSIIPMIKTQCVEGDVIFIAHRLMTTLQINTGQCPNTVLCDICIFSSERPPLVLTLNTSFVQIARAYNAKLAKALTEATRKKGEFSFTNGVLHVKTDFSSEAVLKEKIDNINKDSSFGAQSTFLQMNKEKFELAIQAFCEMLCSCFHLGTENVYFTDFMSILFMELFEERQSIEVKATFKTPGILLLREMALRLARSKLSCVIHCPPEYIADMKCLSLIACVKVQEKKGQSLTLTSTGMKNANFEFVIGQGETVFTAAREKSTNEDDVIDTSAARSCLVKSIIEKSSKEREMTKGERKQLEDTVLVSLRAFESRTVTFLGDLLDGDFKVNDISQYNAFMEDYLMQCFRQRNLELTNSRREAPENDLDTHLHSIRKLAPLLNKELRLEASPLLDRLIQHDVMSEAGRQSIMGRGTPTSRNKAFITYLCGNFTSETFKAQFLPLLSEDHHSLAIKLEDEMDRLTTASKRKEKCTFCKMRDTVNIRRLMDALSQMNVITDSLRLELSASTLPNTVKWTELFKHVRSVESIMQALEQKNEHLYREFIRKGHSFLECTCDASESQRLSDIVGSDNAEGDLANMEDFDGEDKL